MSDETLKGFSDPDGLILAGMAAIPPNTDVGVLLSSSNTKLAHCKIACHFEVNMTE